MANADAILDRLSMGGLFAGRYEIDGMLGRGGMGAVYRVRDSALGEPIALKVLLPKDQDDATELLARFRQEVRLARRVTHPNVARVYDLGEIDGVLFLTMELVEGGTLRTLLHGGRVPFERVAAIGAALAAGLAAAHAVGVIHRDLKPSNVLIDPTGRVVITDFGIARSLDDDLGLTVGAIGTPLYMAPEQASRSGVEPRTDLYALGLILHEMIVGALPRRDGSGTLGASLAALAPPEVAAIVERCLAPSPDDRPRDALEVRDALEAAPSKRELSRPGDPRSGTRAATGRGLASASVPVRGPLPQARALAVLPLRYRGPVEHEEVRDALGDELVDQLSRTRGLRVFASSATARFQHDRDPRVVGRELGAEFVVDGLVQRDGDRLKMTLRLLDAETALQIWSDRAETRFADALAAAEALARRIAEALRVEIGMLAHHATLPDGVLEAYFGARRKLRLQLQDAAIEAREAFALCVARAPGFSPALAGHAMAALRCSFMLDDPDHALARAADEAVERALAAAPELAETHLAAAVLAGHHGEYPSAVKELERALAIAPTYPDAHEYLAMFECEAGLPERGVPRARLALELDPSLTNAALVLARAHAYAGNWDASLRQLDDIDRRLPPNALGAFQTRLRVLAWRRDFTAIDQLIAERCAGPGHDFMRLAAEVIVGRRPLADAIAAHARIIAKRKNLRFLSYTHQVTAEVQALRGDLDGALASVKTAVDAALIDAEWMRRCPPLAPLAGVPAFAIELDRVRVRTRALWI